MGMPLESDSSGQVPAQRDCKVHRSGLGHVGVEGHTHRRRPATRVEVHPEIRCVARLILVLHSDLARGLIVEVRIENLLLFVAFLWTQHPEWVSEKRGLWDHFMTSFQRPEQVFSETANSAA